MTSASQPPKGFFIAGTDTGVGKTVVTACLLRLLQGRGVRAGAMKPVETGVVPGGAESDAEFLIRAGELDDPVEAVAPIRLKTPAAPLIAAQMENVAIDPQKIRKAYDRLRQKYDTVLVEGVGGLLVPILEDYLVADLAVELALPLIVVARPVLGTINHTLLTLEAARGRGLGVRGIVVNSCAEEDGGEVQEKSVEFIQARSGVPVIGNLHYFSDLSSQAFSNNFVEGLRTFLSGESLIGE